MKKINTTIWALFFFLATVFAGQPADLFQQANDAFKANDFDKAIGLYQQVALLGYQSPSLEFNLANAYFRKGETGPAILHYERALLLSPKDEDVLYNLSLAQQKVDKRQQLPGFFITGFWKNIRMALPSAGWGGLALVLWWAGFAGLCLWLLGKNRGQRKTGFSVGLAAVLLSLLPFALGWDRMGYEKNTGIAIVITDGPSLKKAPDEAGSEILKLNEGEKVALLDRLGGYWQVRLLNGETGWVEEGEVEQI